MQIVERYFLVMSYFNLALVGSLLLVTYGHILGSGLLNNGIPSVKGEKAHKKYHYWIVNGAEITNFVFLGSILRNWVSTYNYPFYPIAHLPADADLITGSYPTNNKKRQILFRRCQDGSLPLNKYGWTSSRSDYLNFCK
ncbi:Hypothetical predicted protein [Mytilus galloprovincialis]|uniref:Uncharacterized protein n=1 Tax=Mytilus galloprovincialis TaxID=29158 RepID=A0A8B6C8Y3_MYTGA|nr:Hypothetical predicted protein [Mytilus galloprovincialis]